MGLCHALPDGLKEDLEPFKELLLKVNEYYWAKIRKANETIPRLLGNPVDDGVQAGFWCGVARVGCGALAAAGAAACCVGTATVGCVLCAGGMGAAGGVCIEAWSWC